MKHIAQDYLDWLFRQATVAEVEAWLAHPEAAVTEQTDRARRRLRGLHVLVAGLVGATGWVGSGWLTMGAMLAALVMGWILIRAMGLVAVSIHYKMAVQRVVNAMGGAPELGNRARSALYAIECQMAIRLADPECLAKKQAQHMSKNTPAAAAPAAPARRL